jgi:hypothetical protein
VSLDGTSLSSRDTGPCAVPACSASLSLSLSEQCGSALLPPVSTSTRHPGLPASADSGAAGALLAAATQAAGCMVAAAMTPAAKCPPSGLLRACQRASPGHPLRRGRVPGLLSHGHGSPPSDLPGPAPGRRGAARDGPSPRSSACTGGINLNASDTAPHQGADSVLSGPTP